MSKQSHSSPPLAVAVALKKTYQVSVKLPAGLEYKKVKSSSSRYTLSLPPSSKRSPKSRRKHSPSTSTKRKIAKLVILALLLVTSPLLLTHSIRFVDWIIPLLYARYANGHTDILYANTLDMFVGIIQVLLTILLSRFSR